MEYPQNTWSSELGAALQQIMNRDHPRNVIFTLYNMYM